MLHLVFDAISFVTFHESYSQQFLVFIWYCCFQTNFFPYFLEESFSFIKLISKPDWVSISKKLEINSTKISPSHNELSFFSFPFTHSYDQIIPADNYPLNHKWYLQIDLYQINLGKSCTTQSSLISNPFSSILSWYLDISSRDFHVF